MYFHDKNEPANWETCTLRRWLNSDFYQKAFNENERQLVISDYIETSENWMFETNSGSQVENAVFLLSVEEIYQYFMENPHCQYKQTKKFQEVGPKDFMKAKYTEYAKAKSSYVDNDNNEYGWWWLRTSGEKKGNLTNATMITTGPYLNMKGVSVKFPVDGDKPAGGVRPAIWIRRQLS